jgi:hypothetical protein
MKGVELRIPGGLAASCHKTQERTAWLERLPNVLRNLEHRWSLTLDAPFNDDEVSCSYVAAAVRADGTPAVLKIGMPHMEGAHEIHGLRFWDGDPTVRLLMADDDLGAMLLERCEPGTALRAQQVCYLHPFVRNSSEYGGRSYSHLMRNNRPARRRFGKPPSRQIWCKCTYNGLANRRLRLLSESASRTLAFVVIASKHSVPCRMVHTITYDFGSNPSG